MCVLLIHSIDSVHYFCILGALLVYVHNFDTVLNSEEFCDIFSGSWISIHLQYYHVIYLLNYVVFYDGPSTG